MNETAKSGLRGWPIAGVATLIVLLCAAGAWLSFTEPVDQVRAVIRVTARTSLIFFLLAFTAAALCGLAYVFIAAMTLTSFDRAAAAIGPRAWKILTRVARARVQPLPEKRQAA